VNVKDKNTHEGECTKRFENCVQCGDSYPKRKEHACPEEELDCAYGCSNKIKRIKIEEHDKESAHLHVKFLAHEVMALKESLKKSPNMPTGLTGEFFLKVKNAYLSQPIIYSIGGNYEWELQFVKTEGFQLRLNKLPLNVEVIANFSLRKWKENVMEDSVSKTKKFNKGTTCVIPMKKTLTQMRDLLGINKLMKMPGFTLKINVIGLNPL